MKNVSLSLRLCGLILFLACFASAQIPTPKDVLGFTPGDDRKLASWAQVVDYFIFDSCWKEQFPDLPRRPLLAADENYKLDQLRQCFDASGLTMEILHTPPLSPEEYDEADKIVPK